MRNALAIIVFLLIISLSLAFVPEIPANATRGVLGASVSQTVVVCNTTPCVRNFSVTVTNPTANDFSVYFAEREGDVWIVRDTVFGTIPSKGTATFNFTLTFAYYGSAIYTGRYAIISEDLQKYEFIIEEDWTPYVMKMQDTIMRGAISAAPLLVIVLAVLVFMVTRSARESGRLRSSPEGEPEGTVAKIAQFVTCESFWAVAVFCMLVLMAMTALSQRSIGLENLLSILFISFAVAFFVPVVFILLAWYGDSYGRKPLNTIISMFTWGIFAAFLAFLLNAVILMALHLTTEQAPEGIILLYGSLLIAPIVEEAVKATGLVVICWRDEIDDMLGGLLFGFVIGAGFTAVENWFYFVSKVSPITIGFDAWVIAMIYRSFFNTIAHGCFTAFIGALLGVVKSKPQYKEYYPLALIPGVSIAIVLHIVFNFTAYLDTFSLTFLMFNPLLVIIVFLGFAAIYFVGLSESRKKMLEKSRTGMLLEK